MFYDRFKELCERRGISCNRAALEMGLSNATPTAWKKRGLTPKADTLAVIANYFDVSTDYLLGENWYVVDPISPKQVNTNRVHEILWKYSKQYRKEWKQYRKQKLRERG